jgi:hypothetical protein
MEHMVVVNSARIVKGGEGGKGNYSLSLMGKYVYYPLTTYVLIYPQKLNKKLQEIGLFFP